MIKNNNMATAMLEPIAYNVYCGYSQPKHNSLWSTLYDVYSVYSQAHHTSSVIQSYQRNPKHIPVNTGKVRIGLAYDPSKSWNDPDQDWVQEALLNKANKQSKPMAETALGIVYILAIAAVILTF